ncbi:U6 snRNA phosphodiesterase Usb [Parasponia andersonii]|uniref:U6 snRNA phosphodiesterase n=1 Tax=Parasponia andersonii TaxID=3476 RepID=A0A2P5CGA4_PARAD|nr:U6 snRNA phosphodiesterase Usb [Parasponia andersonii]
MEALIASYGDESSDSESPPQPPPSTSSPEPNLLPPPPISLLIPPNSLGDLDYSPGEQPSRVRTFPHVEGNYALHVYIPVYIPSPPKKELAFFLKKLSRRVPGLHVVDIDVPLDILTKDDAKLEQVALGREFHVSLGRTVPIRVHQIDSVVAMLRQKLQIQRRYWIDFSKWEVFLNDDRTRTFLSMEVTTTGLAEITKQIQAVNEVYKLHNLPEFYKDPRPHISVAWAYGDIDNSLKSAVQEERSVTVGGSLQKCTFTSKFSGIECRIGNKSYKICKFPD